MITIRKSGLMSVVCLLSIGLCIVAHAERVPVEPGSQSVVPLFQRPGAGDVVKDPQAYGDDSKVCPPRTAELQRQLTATAFLGEDFEIAVPPTGWSTVTTHTGAQTWHQAATSFSGFYSAEVEYDPDLIAQDEWLYTPVMDLTGSNPTYLRVDFAVMLSYYWSTSPNDNYDMEVWISTDAGATFNTLLWDETALGTFINYVWYEQSVSLAAYATEPQVVLGFRYVGTDGAQGNFDLVHVTDDPPPVGRCCSGDPAAPSCDDLTQVDCEALGGDWDGALDCAGNPCPTPSPGDDCAAPIAHVLPPGGAYTISSQSTCGHGNAYSTTCLGFYDGGEDIIYEIQVTALMLVNITLDPKGTGWSGMLIDETCPPDPESCLGTVSGSGGEPKTIYGVSLEAGTYYLMVDTWPSPDCIPDFDITLEEIAPPPPIDFCYAAVPIGEVVDQPFSTVGAVNDEDGACMSSPNIWFLYTPSVPGIATIDLCGSDYDTKLAVYDGYSCDPLPPELACNDDACGLQSQVIVPVVDGQEYLIEVGGYAQNFGHGDLSISVCMPAENDDCAGATVQTDFPAVVTGDNTCSTPTCELFPGNQVWEAIEITEQSSVSISYEGTTPAFQNAWLNLAVGCPCDSITYPGSFQLAPDNNVIVTWSCLPPGTYYYPVLSEPGSVGPYQLTIDADPVAGGCYCWASGSTSFEHISRVTIGTIDNQSGNNAYADYTDLETTVYVGREYPITVENGNPWETDETWLYVDWNGDYDFEDSGETLATAGSPGPGPYTTTLVPPDDAVDGPTRMRVRLLDVSVDSPSPCGATIYGEVEDYTLVIDRYVCGDANGNGVVDMADVIFLINYLFSYGPTPEPYFAADGTGDDLVDLADVVYLAAFLFHGGNPPVCPF